MMATVSAMVRHVAHDRDEDENGFRYGGIDSLMQTTPIVMVLLVLIPPNKREKTMPMMMMMMMMMRLLITMVGVIPVTMAQLMRFLYLVPMPTSSVVLDSTGAFSLDFGCDVNEALNRSSDFFVVQTLVASKLRQSVRKYWISSIR